MLKQFSKKQAGFTIVELLIVIVVIGILAALVLNTFQGVQARARDTERRTDLNSIATQLEAYYADFGHYPDNSTATTCGDGTGSCDISVVMPTRGLDADALVDPNQGQTNVNTSADAGDGEYYYDLTGATCSGGQCGSFVLSTTLESDGSVYTKNSLN
ncbi:MAG TPA: type II secretion system protein [Candidatus Saccharimonadales bacterium]